MQVKITRHMKLGEQRLHLIANLLDSDWFTDRRFDMGHWAFTHDVKEYWKPEIYKARRLRDRESGELDTWHELHLDDLCGTTACALGHATLIPELYKAGLRLLVSGEEVNARGRNVDAGATIALVTHRSYTESVYQICEDLFGIARRRVDEIFFGERDAKEEAAQIRATIKSINEHEGFKRPSV